MESLMLKPEPLVKERTKTEGTNILTLLNLLNKINGDDPRAYIPNYQRDCNEWGKIKKSRFIESILNNLTTPAIFLCEDDQGRFEVVDGQQRLNTILEYSNDKFEMVSDDSVDYLSPQSVYYKGKIFSELDKTLKNIFNFYAIAVIYLPPKMDLNYQARNISPHQRRGYSANRTGYSPVLLFHLTQRHRDTFGGHLPWGFFLCR
jgi:hypothetical protein